MENASKALLMAGGILIAILILALLVRTFTNISSFQKSQLTQEEEEQLIAFNEQYTKYLNQYVYGTEVISVINKSLNNTSHKITTKIKFANNGNGFTYNVHTYNYAKKEYESKTVTIKRGEELKIVNDEENNSTVEQFIGSLSEAGEINNMAFKCTNIGYDSNGRVNTITFEEKQWGDGSGNIYYK